MAIDREGFTGAQDNGYAGEAGRGGAAGKRTRTQMLQAKREGRASPAAHAESAVERASSSSGSALPTAVRTKFESSLGQDLSGVRVHTGAESNTAAAAIGAHAYASGNDIHFGSGKYQPEDPFGMHLLAHEVAHTVQQGGGGGSGVQAKLAIGGASDAAEHEADHAADAMVHGAPASVSSTTPGTVQRWGFDDLVDAATDAVSGAASAVSDVFSGAGGGAAANDSGGAGQPAQADPSPAPAPAPPKPAAAPKAPAPPKKVAYDQHPDAEHYDPTGGDSDTKKGGDSPLPSSDRSAAQQAYREQLRAEDEADPNYVAATEQTVTRQDIYQALSRLGPSYSRDFKAMMVGHSFGEQGGRHCVHYNFMGVELWRFTRPSSDKRKWTRAMRSDIITPADFNANPAYFHDWKDSGKGTIEQQIAKGSERIYCLYPGPRAVFSSVDDASKSFWHTIVNWRLKSCQGSANPEHRALASGALAGDVEAYIKMVELSDATIGVKPYNGNAEYPGIVRPHLRHALADTTLND